MSVTPLILAGDVGLGSPFLVALVLVLAGLGVFFLAWAIYTTRRPRAADRPPSWFRREPTYVLMIAAVFVAFWAFTLPFIPAISFNRLVPSQHVQVEAQQFAWVLNSTTVVANRPVAFHVTTKDVTHGFGVYDPRGVLVLQGQVMPGYSNDFVYTFRTPGLYTIRCMEYCGFGHPTMVSTFTVVSG